MTQSWSRALHQRIAKAIKQARQSQYTAQQLADKTAQLGYPISRSQIANYESGRKQTLDVTELLVLAHALNIPALSLLFPGHWNDTIEVVPGNIMSKADAVNHHAGEHEPRVRLQALITELDQLIGVATHGRGELVAESQQQ